MTNTEHKGEVGLQCTYFCRTTGLKRQLLKGTDQEVVVLNNGTEMPLLGLGTSGLDDEAVEKAVKAAIGEAGYRCATAETL